jgi:hypothetical protein
VRHRASTICQRQGGFWVPGKYFLWQVVNRSICPPNRETVSTS